MYNSHNYTAYNSLQLVKIDKMSNFIMSSMCTI